MKQYMITFRSITFAQRGERNLGKRGISCTVGRTPKWMEQQGCGYGVTLRTANLYRAVEILREAGVAWRKVYAWQGGKYEEMTL